MDTDDLDALWHDLFAARITPLEQGMLKGLHQRLAPGDPLLILSALTVRMLYGCLFLNKWSPLRTLSSMHKSMEDCQRKIDVMAQSSRVVTQNLSHWNAMLGRTERALIDARKAARETFLQLWLTRQLPLAGMCFFMGFAGSFLGARL